MSEGADAAQRLRRALLPFTLRNALRLPFYRDLWGKDALEGHDDAEVVLSQLPLLSKEAYRAGLMNAVDEAAAFVSHTSGTTGEILLRYRSAAEAAVIADLFKRRRGEFQLGINISAGPHGMSLPVPSALVFLTAAVNWMAQIDVLLELLGRRFLLGGEARPIEVLAGNAQDLTLLAQAAHVAQGRPGWASLERIIATGFLDLAQSELIAGTFGAPIYTRYSLSEVFGGATAVGTGPLVLDAHVVGEVIVMSGRRAREREVGELVLTELFPFVQLQPLIRYRTGDIVRVVQTGPLAFEWLGRRHQCVLLDEQRAVTFRDLAAVLARDPLVARKHPRAALKQLPEAELGLPDVEVVADDDGTVVIRVVAARNPHIYLNACRDLVRRIWDIVATTSAGADLTVRVRVTTAAGHDGLEVEGAANGPPPAP